MEQDPGQSEIRRWQNGASGEGAKSEQEENTLWRTEVWGRAGSGLRFLPEIRRGKV